GSAPRALRASSIASASFSRPQYSLMTRASKSDGKTYPLLDGLGIDGRARAAADHEGGRAEEELVHAVGGAVLGQLLQIEDLPVHDADGRNGHPVPGLEDVRPRVVGADLDAPRVAADRGDLLAVDPFQALEGQPGSVSARIAAPLALLQPVFPL